MHVAQVNFLPAPEGCTPDALFARWPSLADIPEAASAGGVRVSMIQAADRDASIRRGGVEYRFVDVRAMRSRRASTWRVAQEVLRLRADLVHVHSIGFARRAALLRRLVPGMPILLQDHADRPPVRWLRMPWRRWYGAADGIVFTSLEQARPFTDARLFGTHTRLFPIAESSSRFTPGDKHAARLATGLHGSPCVLSVGHLSEHKGTMTMLDGVARAVGRLPDLQLWCAYGRAPLLDEVRHRIDTDARLAGRVHLLGAVPHDAVETLMRAADVFVSASLREAAGYSVLEAIACGTCPVLTDIPPFRALTREGAIGQLWPVGDAAALAEALQRAVTTSPSVAAIRTHFDETLSFRALGHQWHRAYAELIAGTRR